MFICMCKENSQLYCTLFVILLVKFSKVQWDILDKVSTDLECIHTAVKGCMLAVETVPEEILELGPS